MMIDRIGAGGAASPLGFTAVSSARVENGTGKASFEDVLKNFEKEMRRTPTERARDQVLRAHKLTEDDYKALPPAEKDKIDQEIRAAVKRVLERQKAKTVAPDPARPLAFG